MVQRLTPLNPQMPITEPGTGYPTPFFMRWWQDQLSTNLTIPLLGLPAEVSGVLDVLYDPAIPAHGDVLFRGPTLWEPLTAGSVGQILSTAGSGADPAWITASFLYLSDTPSTYVAAGGQVAKVNAGETGIEFSTVSDLLDAEFGTDHGSLLFRGAAGWQVLGPDTSSAGPGFLKSQGAGFDPIWEVPASGGASDFVSLTDTPAAYANSEGLITQVSYGADALQFVRLGSVDVLYGATTENMPEVGTTVSTSTFASKGNIIDILAKGRIEEVEFSTSTAHGGEVSAAIISANGTGGTILAISKGTYVSGDITTGTAATNTIKLDPPLEVDVGDIVAITVTRTDGITTSNPGVYFTTAGAYSGTYFTTPTVGNHNYRMTDLDLQVGDAFTTAGFFSDNWSIGCTFRLAEDAFVPAGGSTGQVLTKVSGTDFDMEWATPGAGGTLTTSFILACSDETTALTTGAAKVTFRMPYAFTLTEVRASVTTAPTGAAISVDINEGGVSILSTALTIDATEKTSTTAATPAVISDTSLADDAEITIDLDAVGSTIAGAGLKVALIGFKT